MIKRSVYSLMMADSLNFDVEEIINKKLVKNAQKYPIDQALAKNKSDLEAKN